MVRHVSVIAPDLDVNDAGILQHPCAIVRQDALRLCARGVAGTVGRHGRDIPEVPALQERSRCCCLVTGDVHGDQAAK